MTEVKLGSSATSAGEAVVLCRRVDRRNTKGFVWTQVTKIMRHLTTKTAFCNHHISSNNNSHAQFKCSSITWHQVYLNICNTQTTYVKRVYRCKTRITYTEMVSMIHTTYMQWRGWLSVSLPRHSSYLPRWNGCSCPTCLNHLAWLSGDGGSLGRPPFKHTTQTFPAVLQPNTRCLKL